MLVHCGRIILTDEVFRKGGDFLDKFYSQNCTQFCALSISINVPNCLGLIIICPSDDDDIP